MEDLKKKLGECKTNRIKEKLQTDWTPKTGIMKCLVIALLLLLAIQFAAADPLVISAKVRPENPAIGDTVGVYITILGQQNESVQVFTKLKNPTFKVVDVLKKDNIPYNAIKSDTIDFEVSKGQTVEIMIIGEMPNSKTLAVLFPNAYRVEAKVTPNPTTTKTPESNLVPSDKEILWKKYGELYSKYERLKDSIPERLQLIIEEKFRIANSKLESDQLEGARAILNEIEGLLSIPKSQDMSTVFAAVILLVIASASVLIWKYYKPDRGGEEAEAQNFRLLR